MYQILNGIVPFWPQIYSTAEIKQNKNTISIILQPANNRSKPAVSA